MRKLFIILAPITLLVSCKREYFDINKDPNRATESSVSADLIMPYALKETGRMTTIFWTGLGYWLGYWAVPTNYAAGSEQKYDITTGYANGIWNAMYDNIFDYHKAQQKAAAAGQNFYVGISMIMKSLVFQYLVDQFNNVPYSKALDVSGNITPAYDKGDVIYADLLRQITAGINMIKNADPAANARIGDADIMFHGDKTKWAKFGNTLKLRILMHQSQIPGFNPAAEIAIINAEGSGFIGAGGTATVNPGFTSNKPNDFWSRYMFTQTGLFADDFARANNYNMGLSKTLLDERYKYFYRAVRAGSPYAGTWRSMAYGETNDPTPRQYSQADLSDVGGAPSTSGGTSGLGKSATEGAWIITGYESLFLQTEAIVRGWIPGNAQQTYTNAVYESFDWLGVPNAHANADVYLATGDPKTLWPATQADQIKVIAWQKYFAENGNNLLEAWNDYRRLDVVTPAISIDPGRISNTIPIRYLYPSDEYSYNAGNALGEGQISQFTSKIFWDR